MMNKEKSHQRLLVLTTTIYKDERKTREKRRTTTTTRFFFWSVVVLRSHVVYRYTSFLSLSLNKVGGSDKNDKNEKKMIKKE